MPVFKLSVFNPVGPPPGFPPIVTKGQQGPIRIKTEGKEQDLKQTHIMNKLSQYNNF